MIEIAVSPLGFRKKQGMSTNKNRALKPPKTGEIRANQCTTKQENRDIFSAHARIHLQVRFYTGFEVLYCIVLYCIALYCLKRDNYPMLPQIMWKFGMMLPYSRIHKIFSLDSN